MLEQCECVSFYRDYLCFDKFALGGGGGVLHSQLCFLFVSFSFSAMTPETGSDFKT